MPDNRLSSSFSLACELHRVLNSHKPHKFGRRIAGQERGDLFDPLSYLTGKGRCLHLQRRMAVAMHDLAQGYLVSNRFGQQERIEREQQLVFLCKFVGEFEAIGDELGSPAMALGGYPLNSV
jgi:hypothetical protein